MEDKKGKKAPRNIDAERSALGATMLDKDALRDVLDTIKEADFYSANHQAIYRAIKSLYIANKEVDFVTVSDELKKQGKLELVGGMKAVEELTDATPSIYNAVEYAKIVAEKAMLRRLISAGDAIAQKGYREDEEPLSILEFAEKEVFSIAKEKQSGEVAEIGEILVQNLSEIEERAKNKGMAVGLPSGLSDLDKKLSGFKKSDRVVVAARPAMGKTAFCLNIAHNAATKHDASVLIFSLEMAKEQLSQRLLSMEARIESHRMSSGDISSKEDWQRLTAAVSNLSKGRIMIDDTPGLNMMEIKNKCRRIKAEKGLDMVILDYLQLMESDGRTDNRQQEISNMSRSMKLLAREMDCPVIVLSQLSRSPDKRENHRPVLSDLRESGAIEQDADIVIFLYRDEVYHPETERPNVCEIIIAKHRNGPIGTVEVNWQGKYTRFTDLHNG